MGCSLSGCPVHGISQARILEWVAISFTTTLAWCSINSSVVLVHKLYSWYLCFFQKFTSSHIQLVIILIQREIFLKYEFSFVHSSLDSSLYFLSSKINSLRVSSLQRVSIIRLYYNISIMVTIHHYAQS